MPLFSAFHLSSSLSPNPLSSSLSHLALPFPLSPFLLSLHFFTQRFNTPISLLFFFHFPFCFFPPINFIIHFLFFPFSFTVPFFLFPFFCILPFLFPLFFPFFFLNFFYRLWDWGPPRWWGPQAAAQSALPFNPLLHLTVHPGVEYTYNYVENRLKFSVSELVTSQLALRCQDGSPSSIHYAEVFGLCSDTYNRLSGSYDLVVMRLKPGYRYYWEVSGSGCSCALQLVCQARGSHAQSLHYSLVILFG